MIRRTLLSLPIATAILALGGCAYKQPLLFKRSGRFSLVTTSTSGEREAVNGRFSLYRTSDSLHLDLMTPLNGILASIEVTPSGAVLTTAQDDAPVTASNAEELIRLTTGVTVPIEALERWLTMTGDRASEFGWLIRVLNRRADGTPGTIRASTTSPTISLTLKLDED